jgi:ACR3 family arsenite transporter
VIRGAGGCLLRDRTKKRNAVFQVLAYAGLGVFYLNVLPAWLDLPTQSLHVSFAAIAVTVVVFLGIPLVAGFLTRTLGERARGQEWYETTLLPRIAPIALYGLLFTVVVLFALQARRSPPSHSTSPGSRCRCWSTSP